MLAIANKPDSNSILLVDFIDEQLAAGADLEEAVIQAAAVLGAFFILDDPIFNGLAISLIFGILISTLLTLVVIPVLFYALKYRQLTRV